LGRRQLGQRAQDHDARHEFWGHIAFTFDQARKHFDGKWAYCDDPVDRDWTGDIAK